MPLAGYLLNLDTRHLAHEILSMTKLSSRAWLRGALVLAMAWSCATPAAGTRKYPPRSPGCDLAFYPTPVPGVAAWDELGVVEAACNINDSPAECLRLLRAEACRLGGDLVYDVPRKPLRPRDQVLLYRGHVGHSRAVSAKSASADLATPPSPSTPPPPPPPPPASAEESTRPVVPLGSGEPSPLEAPTTSPATSSPGSSPVPPASVDLRLRPRALPASVSPADAGVEPPRTAAPTAPDGERG